MLYGGGFFHLHFGIGGYLKNNKNTKKVDIPKGTVITAGGNNILFKKWNLKAGATFTCKTFDSSSGKIETETYKVTGSKKVMTPEGELEAFETVGTSTDMPGVSMNLLVTQDGKLVEMKSMGMIRIAWEKREDAEIKPKGVDLSSYIPVVNPIEAWETLEIIKVKVKVEGDKKGDLFKDTPYQTSKKEPGNYLITCKKISGPTACSDQIPITPKDKSNQKYLKSALYIQSADPAIQKKAREIVGKETNALVATKKLCGWVFTTLEKGDINIAAASAAETLKNNKGDCTEHAVLLCALARSLGIPTREVTGMVLRGSVFGYHAWSEFLLDGKWVPVDATINMVGLPAGAIKFGHDDGNQTSNQATTLMVKLFGKTKLEIVSATREGKTFNPAVKAESIKFTENELHNQMLGYRFDMTGDWKNVSQQEKINLMSPEGLIFSVTLLPAYHTKKEEDQFVKEFLTGVTKGKILARKQQNLAGKKGLCLEWEFQQNGKTLQAESRTYNNGIHIYLVTCLQTQENMKTHKEKIPGHFKRFKAASLEGKATP